MITRTLSLAAALLLALAGCASSSTPGVGTTPSPTAPPTETPTIEHSSIVTSADGFTIVHGSTSTEFDFFATSETVVPALTAVFNADPQVIDEPEPLGTHVAGFTSYDWGGFVWIQSRREVTPTFPPGGVAVSVPAIGEVTISTASGAQVGNPMPSGPLMMDMAGWVILDEVDQQFDFGDGSPTPWWVVARPSADGTTIGSFSAPILGYGP